MYKKYLLLFLLIIIYSKECIGIWCYRCTSAVPGCGENFTWRGIGYFGEQCPYDQDICVKVTERKGAHVTYTRDCLSSLYFRTDIPADHYEGCRPAIQDFRIANYVNHSIKENDVKRNYYDSIEFCFCFLDHRCNSSNTILSSIIMILLTISITIFNFI